MTDPGDLSDEQLVALRDQASTELAVRAVIGALTESTDVYWVRAVARNNHPGFYAEAVRRYDEGERR